MTTGEPRSDITWEEPPSQTSYDWEAIAAKAKRRPGKWALVDKGHPVPLSKVSSIRQGTTRPLSPELGFEITQRNTDKDAKTCTLYVLYNPDKDRSK